MNKKSVKYQEIVIDWSGLKDLKESTILGEKDVLYQIYGNSHIYGLNTLLYIGKTNQMAKSRLAQHIKGVFGYCHDLKFSVGTVGHNKLEVPESILIANHKPCFNKEYIHTLDPDAMKHKIIIINNGNHLMLKNSCTNFWWVDGKEKEIAIMEGF